MPKTHKAQQLIPGTDVSRESSGFTAVTTTIRVKPRDLPKIKEDFGKLKVEYKQTEGEPVVLRGKSSMTGGNTEFTLASELHSSLVDRVILTHGWSPNSREAFINIVAVVDKDADGFIERPATLRAASFIANKLIERWEITPEEYSKMLRAFYAPYSRGATSSM